LLSDAFNAFVISITDAEVSCLSSLTRSIVLLVLIVNWVSN
jgi:hypothetical protein